MIDQSQDLTDALIMMIDDEPITMHVVQTFLEEFGYSRFIQVDDALAAVKAVEMHAPDILLLDLMMPGRSGMEILEEIRGRENFKHLPVVVLTASSDAQDKLRALELGATDFLSKPVDQSELCLRVRNTLAAKAYMDQLVFYDLVTKLPNTNLFELRYDWALKNAARQGLNLALLNITIDNFSRISSAVGLGASDQLLKMLADRLRVLVREIDMLAATSGTERGSLGLFRAEGSSFSLLLDNPKTAESSAVVAKRILQAIKEPVELHDQELIVTASIGIATYPEESRDGDKIRRMAISARDYCKNNGGDQFQFSSFSINSSFEKRLVMETNLRRAIENNEFILNFQPKVAIENGELTGVEALLRWNSKKLGMIPPNEFIPVAEDTKLIVSIGEWVLMEACKAQVAWGKMGKQPVVMSVNISPMQMDDPHFVEIVRRIIESTEVDPGFVNLEITESMLLNAVDEKIKLLHELCKLGVNLSIDDFGTGYSSLSYLGKLPVSELKIDRSFVTDIETNEESRAIVSSIVFMAHNLRLATVAEGIETSGQLEFIREQKCDSYQGFYFSKPLPFHEITELMPDIALKK